MMRRRAWLLVPPLAAGFLVFSCGGGAEVAPREEVSAAAGVAAGAEPEELLLNGRMPFAGVLTGGQPTVEQLAAAREAGYRTVINLRTAGEPGTGRAEVEALGLDYVAIPVAGAEGLTRENAEALAAALAAAEQPVIVHCGSGNRVGALFALKAFYLDGESPEAALAIGKAAGVTRLEPAVRELLGLED